MFDEMIDVIEEEPIEKDRKRAKRRKTDITKALRKRNICKNVYRHEWYNNLHQYSKNKIHCSCCMCSFNNKKKKYKVYTHSELMQRERMDYDEKELKTGA